MAGPKKRTVFVVDDDKAGREALAALLGAAGLTVECFESGAAFLERAMLRRPCCLVLDVRMPGLSGPSLQDVLNERRVRLPILFVTADADVRTAVAAMKKGAYDFIEKPCDESYLLGQVLSALQTPAASGRSAARVARELVEQLSEREREVLDRVLEGKRSREIAKELFVGVKTVEYHRARIMQKLGVRSAAELLTLCLAS